MQKKEQSAHIRQFCKYSKEYQKYNFIQKIVAKELLKKLNFTPKSILDIGCGSGVIYKNLPLKVDRFVGVDFSKEMLALHPKKKEVELIFMDFDEISEEFLASFDLVISSSSLQWSKDIEQLLDKITSFSKNFLLSFFCDGTFLKIREFLEIDTFLPNAFDLAKKYSFVDGIRRYRLKNISPLEQLRYIKKSGVSGGEKIVSVKKIREFLKRYEIDELEFEVIFMSKIK